MLRQRLHTFARWLERKTAPRPGQMTREQYFEEPPSHVYYATGDGRILKIGDVMPTGRISALTEDAEHTYAAMEPGS